MTFKNGYGFSAKVSVEGNTFASTGIQATGKDAEQNAAHAALISLQLIDASVKFDAKASTGTVSVELLVACILYFFFFK